MMSRSAMPRFQKRLWLAFLLLLALTPPFLLLLPHLRSLLTLLQDPSLASQLEQFSGEVGLLGALVLLLFQVLQIVIAVLPGGLVELASGILYGPINGFMISIVGILIGTLCAFWLARALGAPLVRRLVNAAQFDRYTTLCQSKKFEMVALLFFFLPGVPKDVLIYALGCSGALSRRFVGLATLARIPSVAVSCFAGSVFGEGKPLTFAAIYLAFLAAGAIGALVHRLVLKRIESGSLHW